VIGANLGRIVPELLAAEGLTADAVDRWAVHPGGKAILDKVETTLGLDAAQLAASRAVLRDYGNMSSATILFVLEQMLQAAGAVPQTVAAMAFGPGLTIECGLLETVPARSGPGAQPRPATVAA
jgi:predicted naringenin-chalcone synthase